MVYPSEWTKFFDERAGRYRFKHKGSGVVRDVLLSLEREFKKGATQAAQLQQTAKAAAQKVGQVVFEKGGKKIRQILQKRSARPKAMMQAPPPSDTMWKLSRILANPL